MYFKIDLKIFIIATMCAFVNKIELYACIMLFAFIHELGHLICGLIMGFKPIKMTAMPYGFNVCFKINYDDYNKKVGKGSLLAVKRMFVAIAGPITNIVIAIIVLILSINNVNILGTSYYNECILYSNLLLTVFNLLPIYPMDGGRILKEVLHIYCGLTESYDIIQDVTWISIAILTAVSSVLTLYYKNLFILLVIIYLWIITIKTIRQIYLKQKLYEKLCKLTKNS